MLSYINSQLFGQERGVVSMEKLDKMISEFDSDNRMLQKEISGYEEKIEKLPVEIKKSILQQQNNYQQPQTKQVIFADEQSPRRSPKLQHSSQSQSYIEPHTANLKRDKKSLQLEIANLQEQQAQIDYIIQLTDTYIRCKKQYQTASMIPQEQQPNTSDHHTIRERLNRQRLLIEQQQMEKVSIFIKNLQPYRSQKSFYDEQSTLLINNIIEQIKLHTGKKLIEKCENLVHAELISGNQNIIIQTYLIQNCRDIILASTDSISNFHSQKNLKIINKFIEKILSNVIYYDVSYQKIILMEVIKQDENTKNKHQDIIKRKKLLFSPNETDKYFDTLKFAINYHVQKVQQLRNVLFFKDSEQQKSILTKEFDKIAETHLSTIKSTLEYILPYLNIKSRKDLMNILTHGKDEMIQFQDLVLRLKFKGQDGDMFMSNLDAVFNRLIDIKCNSKTNQQIVNFNDANFDILTSFFQLGISQAEESLLESSSKAIMKFTTTLSKKIQDKSGQNVVTKYNSKKLFNMIFFSVSNLIQRFDSLVDEKDVLFSTYCEKIQQTYQEKVGQWATRLIQIRERVRVKIHQE